jgi:hypothetical protein
MSARADDVGALDERFRGLALEPAALEPGAAHFVGLVREDHEAGRGPRDFAPVTDSHGKSEIAGTFDARDDDDLVFGRDGDVAGLADVLRELAHDGQRGFDQRAHGRLRHGEREQLVGEHVARAVLRGRDEALELEHLQHPEQLAGGAAEAL